MQTLLPVLNHSSINGQLLVVLLQNIDEPMFYIYVMK